MTAVMEHAESTEEMQRVAMMFIMDQDYSRSAICQAMKDVEKEKGWRP